MHVDVRHRDGQNGPIRIHSLQVGEEMTVVFAGTSSQPSHVAIATTLDNLGNVELDNSSLTAPRIDNANGIESQGTSVLTSPALQSTGTVDALAGSLTLPDSLARLSNGTLTGGSWDADVNGTLVLPGDVTNLVSGQVGIGENSVIDDPAGHNALSGLTSVGAQGTLTLADDGRSLSGGLTSSGTINIGAYPGTSGTLSVAGHSPRCTGFLAMTAGSLTAVKVVIGPRGVAVGRRDPHRQPGQQRRRRPGLPPQRHGELHPGAERHPVRRLRPGTPGHGQGHAGRRAPLRRGPGAPRPARAAPPSRSRR
jgi:hypothetical protein